MTLGTLERRDVSKIDRMLERLVRLVAMVASVSGQRSQVDRVLKGARLDIFLRRPGRVVDNRVTHVAVISNDFSRLADVVAGMTSKTPRSIKVTEVVWMSLPIGLHLREKVVLKNALNFRDRALDLRVFVQVQILVARTIEFIQVFVNRLQRLRSSFVRAGQRLNGFVL